MWIARDKDGDLTIYTYKPIKNSANPFVWWPLSSDGYWAVVDKDQYPEVTWENSPVELVTKL